MTTGQRIKSARKKANMTQAELAQKLDIPFQSVSQWERGIRSPKIETLAKIANALNVSLSDLLWEGDEPIPDDAFILVAGKRGAYIVDSQRRDAISLRNFIIDDVKKLVENLHIANLDDLWSIQDHLENCVNILNARKQALSNSEDLTETPKHKKNRPRTETERNEVCTVKLDDIVNEILEISKAIGSNTHTKSQLDAKKMLAAADLLASIVQPFIPNVTKSYTPSKSKLKVALRSLKKAASDYNIKEDLRKPIKELEAYLDSLG